MNQIEAANKIASEINNANAYAKARVWTNKDEEGNYTKVRVYLEKGYVEVKADQTACIETVGRNFFEVAKNALIVVNYRRVYS